MNGHSLLTVGRGRILHVALLWATTELIKEISTACPWLNSVCERVRDSVEIQRRWGGRWEGVFRMGNTGTPMADSCQCMAKATTIL